MCSDYQMSYLERNIIMNAFGIRQRKTFIINTLIIPCLCVIQLSCSSAPTAEKAIFRHVPIITGKSRSQYEATGKKYMITTQGDSASRAGEKIFDQGGNIIDAAVAVSFAISVERPQSTGLGGGGFLLYYDAKTKKTEAADFREMAPNNAYKKMYLDKLGKVMKDVPQTGGLAVATPGLVKGLLEVHKKYGKLPLADVIAPAIELAEKGFKIYPALEEAILAEKNRLLKYDDSKEIFFNKLGEPLKAGELLIQKDLANTLKQIARHGENGFYSGYVAKNIVQTTKENNGILNLNDLKNYQVKWRTPVFGSFREYEIYSMPPPSSGGTHVIQILNILENENLKSYGGQTSKAIQKTATAMELAFVDRSKYMGDPDFVDVPIQMLISKEYAKDLAKKIPENKSLSSDSLKEFEVKKEESPETTHFTIADGEGNIVTSTQTVNGWFGSAMTAKNTGVILNNEMDDFATDIGAMNMFGAVGGDKNLPEPKKRPLSSMSPTIILKDKKPFMALGTPSGTRIITCVAQTILNRIEYDLSLWDSVTSIRYHHQWFPEELRIEEPGFTQQTEEQLKKMGFKINKKDLGCKIQAIEIKSDGTILGVSDPREEGMAIGR